MCTFETTPNGSRKQEATVRKVAELPDAKLVNGMATVSDGIVLVADSLAGLVWKVDVGTGAVSVATDDQTLKGPSATVAGVNGIITTPTRACKLCIASHSPRKAWLTEAQSLSRRTSSATTS